MKLFTLVVIVLAGLAAGCGTPRATLSPDADQLHVVKRGDSYEQLAALYQVDQGALLAANGLTAPAPLESGRLVVIPGGHAAVPATGAVQPSEGVATAAAPSESLEAAPAVFDSAESAPAESEPVVPGPTPFSREWRDAQWQRAQTQVEDLRAREGGIFVLGGIALLGGFLALQVVIWLARELVSMLIPLVRKVGLMGHDLGLNIWYALWWAGLGILVPARAGWRFVGPWVEPRARASGKYALEHGTVWTRRAALWAQVQGKRAAIAARDEAIDALEELALNRPSLRGVSEKVQELAYMDSRAMRARLLAVPAEAWPPSEQELLDALDEGSLSVRFAPLLDMTAVDVAAHEASLTWERADSGAVPSTRLAALIERPGYTRIQRALLERVLGEACARLQEAGDPRKSVVVPLGRTQFFDPTLFAALRTVLQESKADPSRLELGIDERAVLSDLAAAGEVLARLREAGVRTSLRGFGALTSAQLRVLPVTAVTVDFWNSRRDERIEAYVAESVRTAREAGLSVTASRAETPDEVEFARSLGCERLTGVLPSPAAAEPEAVAAAETYAVAAS